MRQLFLLAILIGGVVCATIDQHYYFSRQPKLFRLLVKYRMWPKNTSTNNEQPTKDLTVPTPFIYGGESASIESFPYQLSLRLEGTHICGASVIAERWALTAAHCLDHAVYPAGITLRGGSPHRLAGGYIFHADQYTLHPKFNGQTLDYDVAVVHVKESFFIDLIQAVSMADTSTIYPVPSAAIVTGWGFSDDAYSPVILQSLQVYIQENAVCMTAWIDQRTDRMICASGGAVGKDVCNGDSGGPLVLNGYQIGIVSFGSIPSCAVNEPGVYTSLTNDEIRGFIKLTTGI
uniref:Peptidase S1 domain-containing protein n=1 Tax=Anopheles atroparvus TaxID=41427 RepID=A0A182JDD9_ANOAO